MARKMKSNRYGKVWIDTEDFFKSTKIQKTINELLESDIVKEIDRKKGKGK